MKYIILCYFDLLSDFKTPLEPFEWDLIREEDRSVDTINNDNTVQNISP